MSAKIPLQQVPDDAVKHHDPFLPISRKKPQPRFVIGFFQHIRLISMYAVLALFVGLPWLRWDGRQALWFNIPERQFFVFGATFAPQDFFMLSWVFIMAALTLFVVTVFGGRVFCGYACPQTVWTHLFMQVEKWFQGDRNARMKLDKQPMNGAKLGRKAAKHGIWVGVSLLTAITFVGYFTPIRELVIEILTGQASGWAYFWTGFFTLATYGNAGYLREQVCIYMCPYARFQSVMFDQDTLIVSYDPRRGESRGPRKKDADYKAQGLGDCIDCKMCVQVCPTGIDIRDGLQIECIGCAACIDACDDIMDKMNYPKGLISYTTEHNLSGRKTHLLRPRLIGYAVALVAMIGLFAWAVANRPLVELDVLKDRVLFRENERGHIENVYTLKIMNKAQRDMTYVITADGLDGLVYEGKREVRALAGEVYSFPVELSIAPEKLPSSANNIVFHVQSADDPSIKNDADSRFIGPSVR